jgi:two-component system, NtrC family, sensor kinase
MAQAQRVKILVADEDPAVIELIADQVLAPLGYHVASATDGASALQTALRLAPDILITSLELSGLSGRDLLAALRSQGYEATIIATGPGGSESQALQAFRLGAKDYLAKPLREAELVASVDRALGEVRLRAERQQLAEKLASANQQLEKRVRELTTLASIGKAVTATTNVNQLFTRLLEAGIFVTEAEAGWLLIADEPGGQPILRAGKHLPNHSDIRLNQPWDDGISALLMLSGEGITLAGPALARLRAGQVVKSAVAVPLKAKDQPIGVLVAGSKTGRHFTERDQAMLSAVADYAAIAMMNARTFLDLESRIQRMQQDQYELARREQQLRSLLAETRSTLELVLNGQPGALAQRQEQALRSLLSRLADHGLEQAATRPA